MENAYPLFLYKTKETFRLPNTSVHIYKKLYKLHWVMFPSKLFNSCLKSFSYCSQFSRNLQLEIKFGYII